MPLGWWQARAISENATTVVALDGGDIAVVAARVRQWLLDRGVAVVNTRRDPLWRPSELSPGPAWRTAVEDEDEGFEVLANNGIDIYTDRIERTLQMQQRVKTPDGREYEVVAVNVNGDVVFAKGRRV